MAYRDDTLSSEERLAALYVELRAIEAQLAALAPLVARRDVVAKEIAERNARAIRAMHPGPRPWHVLLAVVVLLTCALGLTLIEAISTPCGRHPVNQTRSDAQSVRSAVLLYLGQEPGAKCPTLRELVDTGTLDHGRRTTDAWDHPFRIACDGDEIIVRSDGADGMPGTSDDLE